MALFAFIGVAVTSATLTYLREVDLVSAGTGATIQESWAVGLSMGAIASPPSDQHRANRRQPANDYRAPRPRFIGFAWAD